MLVGGGKEAELLEGQDVVDNFFETLGVPAQPTWATPHGIGQALELT
jgi:hypothetical protein